MPTNSPLSHVSRFRWVGPTPSLSVAVIAVWAAVCYQSAADWFAGRLTASPLTLAGAAGLLLVMLLFLVDNIQIGAGMAPRLRQGVVLLQGPCALLAYEGLHSTLQLALLVVVATQFAKTFQRRTALALLAAVNLVLLFQIMPSPQPDSGTTIITFFGFQLFAMLTVGYSVSARRAHADLLRINGELLATRHLLHESARTEERLRLSRDLHDVAGHKLTALKLQLRQVARAGLGEASDIARDCAALADELLVDVRGMVGVLRHDEGIDLQSSLDALVTKIPYPAITLTMQKDARVTDIEQANALLRCAQEGLTNALRHSEARHIVIALAQADGATTLTVEDDGRGQPNPRRGNGLTGMQERLQSLGGVLEITSRAGHGLRLCIVLPLASPKETTR